MNRKRYAGCSAGGYLTISLAITLTLVISLALTLIEGVRRNTMMLEIECAVDTGMNNILAEYHRELWQQYGLFFIDTSYGTGKPDYHQTLEHLKEYISINLGEQEKLLEIVGSDFTDLHVKDGEVLELSVASDEGGAVMRRQIAECMEEKIGITYLQEILEWINVIEAHDMMGTWYADMKQEAESGLANWEEILKNQKESTGSMNFLETAEWMKQLQAGVLQLMLGLEDISNAEIIGGEYLSHRTLLEGTGIAAGKEFEDGLWEQLLLCEFVLDKTGRYGVPKNGSKLQYQTEYILCGVETDVGNLSEVVDKLLVFRETANAVHILACQEKMDIVKTLSDSLASALGAPEVSLVFQILFVVLWAGFEGLWDVEQLLEGNAVPLLKSDTQWHYGLPNISGQESQGFQGTEQELRYEDYLRIFLMLQDKQVTTYRLMDIMEMDIRMTDGNREFRMDGCADCVKVKIDVESGYGYDFSVTRRYGY